MSGAGNMPPPNGGADLDRLIGELSGGLKPVRRMLPPFINQSIIHLKNTSLVSNIAVPDLLYQAQAITADTYRPLETYTAVAVIYFLLLFPTTLLAQAYERRLNAGR